MRLKPCCLIFFHELAFPLPIFCSFYLFPFLHLSLSNSLSSEHLLHILSGLSLPHIKKILNIYIFSLPFLFCYIACMLSVCLPACCWCCCCSYSLTYYCLTYSDLSSSSSFLSCANFPISLSICFIHFTLQAHEEILCFYFWTVSGIL